MGCIDEEAIAFTDAIRYAQGMCLGPLAEPHAPNCQVSGNLCYRHTESVSSQLVSASSPSPGHVSTHRSSGQVTSTTTWPVRSGLALTLSPAFCLPSRSSYATHLEFLWTGSSLLSFSISFPIASEKATFTSRIIFPNFWSILHSTTSPLPLLHSSPTRLPLSSKPTAKMFGLSPQMYVHFRRLSRVV